MEKYYFEEPSIERKEDAFNYINEFREYGSNINGSGGLDRYVESKDYEGWIKKVKEDKNFLPNEKKVPACTYFFVRESDNRIIGMINIRTTLNERLKKHGGHIGYSIRPTERKKGYNKINLYLGLQVCDSYNISKVLMDADINNQASWKTMEALGGKRIKEYYDEEYLETIVKYEIDVKKSLEEYKEVYKPYIRKLK